MAEYPPRYEIKAGVAVAHVRFTYKNWRGVISTRHVTPDRVWFGSTIHHPTYQWLLDAFDHDRSGAKRTFAMKDISAWEQL